jgi:hypothetical protein
MWVWSFVVIFGKTGRFRNLLFYGGEITAFIAGSGGEVGIKIIP